MTEQKEKGMWRTKRQVEMDSVSAQSHKSKEPYERAGDQVLRENTHEEGKQRRKP